MLPFFYLYTLVRYLERDVFSPYSERVSFLTPDVTQWIKLGQGENKECAHVVRRLSYNSCPLLTCVPVEADLGFFLAPLSLDRKELIFLAVNDNEAPDEAGGSHW